MKHPLQKMLDRLSQAKPSQSLTPSNAQIKPAIEPVRIAAVGLLKAGKSSFLSAITQQPERFKSGVIRTTIQNQVHSDDFFTWIDTPGIDDTEQETASAFAGLKNADLVLFVHNLKQGELDLSEMQFIQQCVAQDSHFLQRLRFVLTHVDDVGDPAAAEIQRAIEKQCLDKLKHKAQLFIVSSPRYLKGIAEQKQLLIQRSNIPALQAVLVSFYRTQKISDMQQRTQRLRSKLELELKLIENQQKKLELKPASELKPAFEWKPAF